MWFLQSRPTKLDSLLEQIKSINNRHSKINYGGCGIFAYYLSFVLDRYNISHQIVYIKERFTDPRAFRCDVKFEHILIDIGDYYLDNNGFHKKKFETYTLYREKLGEMILEPRLWSNNFNWKLKDNLIQDINKIIL